MPESRARARASVAGGANAGVTRGGEQGIPEGAMKEHNRVNRKKAVTKGQRKLCRRKIQVFVVRSLQMKEEMSLNTTGRW